MRCALILRGRRARGRRGGCRRARCSVAADDAADGAGAVVAVAAAGGARRQRRSGRATEASHALALQLLNRYGVLMRETVAAENVPGGFQRGVRRAEGDGRERAHSARIFCGRTGRDAVCAAGGGGSAAAVANEPPEEKPEFVQLAATDPANPYGSVLRWPDLPVAEEDSESAPRMLTRAAYAEVILRNGQLVAWLRRGNPNLLVFLPAEEPERSQAAAGLAHFLCARGQERMRHRPRGNSDHDHQRAAGGGASDGAVPDGCGVSCRAAGHAFAEDSVGGFTPAGQVSGKDRLRTMKTFGGRKPVGSLFHFSSSGLSSYSLPKASCSLWAARGKRCAMPLRGAFVLEEAHESPCVWVVSRGDNGVRIDQRSMQDALKDSGSTRTCSLNTENYKFDRGEWIGDLRLKKQGVGEQILLKENVIGLFSGNPGVLVLTGLLHLDADYGGAWLVHTTNDKKWSLRKLFDLNGKPRAIGSDGRIRWFLPTRAFHGSTAI